MQPPIVPQIVHKFLVDLPKKHGRGGQSALRFARLRMEKRHNYVRKVHARAGGAEWGHGALLGGHPGTCVRVCIHV